MDADQLREQLAGMNVLELLEILRAICSELDARNSWQSALVLADAILELEQLVRVRIEDGR